MGRFLKITLDDNERAELTDAYKNGDSHTFRQHCQMVLLKADGRKSKDIADFLGCCQKSVNDWLHRYRRGGIEALRIKAGRGRRGILSETDSEAVRRAVTAHRQRVGQATRRELETELGKPFSQRTLVRFLKNLVADINA